MRISGIIRYSSAAGLFALTICIPWLVYRFLRLQGRKICLRREGLYLLTIAYLSALFQITALRIGLVTPRWLGGSICPIPFQTTLQEASSGLWPLVYHIIGNMIWFVPLGMLLPCYSEKWKGLRILLCGGALSLMIEGIQYVLGTGISDIDDIILNALGGLFGYFTCLLFISFKKSFNK